MPSQDPTSTHAFLVQRILSSITSAGEILRGVETPQPSVPLVAGESPSPEEVSPPPPTTTSATTPRERGTTTPLFSHRLLDRLRNEGIVLTSGRRFFQRFHRRGLQETVTPPPGGETSTRRHWIPQGVGPMRFEYHPVGYSCHKEMHVPLLSETPDPGKADMKGLLNLFAIVIVSQNAQAIMRNLMEYGLMVRLVPSPQFWFNHWAFILAILGMQVVSLANYGSEMFCTYVYYQYCTLTGDPTPRRDSAPLLKPMNEDVFKCFQLSTIGLSVIFSSLMLLCSHTVSSEYLGPASSTLLLCFGIAWTLKLVSFQHVMYDTRAVVNKGFNLEDCVSSVAEREVLEKFPLCVGWKYFLCYMWMPTLCFQYWYPRTSRIDYVLLLRHLACFLLSSALIKIIIEQYMVIIVQNTFSPSVFDNSSYLRLIIHFFERLLRLSIPTLYVWLLMFLGGFHNWLTILSELTYFGDRQFYFDWWNATGFGQYWRRWNLPVHNFATRHIYKPLINRGFSRMAASQFVFFLSAAAHEYLVCAPLKVNFTGLVFTAFMAQFPLSLLIDGAISPDYPNVGNAVFWIAFCFTGQPLAVLAYYYVWGVKSGALTPMKTEGVLKMLVSSTVSFIHDTLNKTIPFFQ